MPWKERTRMSSKKEFIQMLQKENESFVELCKRYEISPKTGYKWLHRFEEEGEKGLEERSRKPRHSPLKTSPEIEEAVVLLRFAHPSWGGATLQEILRKKLPASGIPAASTITDILRRHGLISPVESRKRKHFIRFERPLPNDLWQMDFKGHFALRKGRCHPLTVLDDHSRFSIGICACGDEQETTVKGCLIPLFRRYGLPWQMSMDNGSPWGNFPQGYTTLSLWLMQLGIDVIFSSPGHPQTQGKEERFHRTLKAEVLQGRTYLSLQACQKELTGWREIYNWERPHHALQMQVPGSRYTPSHREYPEGVVPWIYDCAEVRKVQQKGEIFFRGKVFRIAKVFYGQQVGLFPTVHPQQWKVFFRHQYLGLLDQSTPYAKITFNK
jgi:transposase InsO family protein/transposase-like protein